MPLVTVKDKFQVTIPAKLRERIKIQIGDLLEVSVHEEGLLLRPKEVVDRKAIADQVEAILRDAPADPEDRGKSEDDIMSESIADVAASRSARRHSDR
jgi:AbrB family looped-hinge helix DNA binding protein